MPNTIVIVGAGFSGTVLAARLLRQPPPDATDIVLVERGGAMGRGVAYAARTVQVLGLAERGGLLRTGVSMYNTRDEMNRLLAALHEFVFK